MLHLFWEEIKIMFHGAHFIFKGCKKGVLTGTTLKQAEQPFLRLYGELMPISAAKLL